MEQQQQQQVLLQDKLQEFQLVQKEYANWINKRQQLEAQLHENTLVIEQLKKLNNKNKITSNVDQDDDDDDDDDDGVWKLVGPVLVRQRRKEAEANVEKRLMFIKSEIERVESSLKRVEQDQETKRQYLIQLSQQSKPAVSV